MQSQIGIVEEDIIQRLWVNFEKPLSNLKKRELQMKRLLKHQEENTFPSNFSTFNYEKHFQLPETFSEDVTTTFHNKMAKQINLLKQNMLETLIEAYHIDLANLRQEVHHLFSEDYIFSASDNFLPQNEDDKYLGVKANIHLALNTKRGIFLNPKMPLEKQKTKDSNSTPMDSNSTQLEENIEESGLTEYPMTQFSPFRPPPNKKRPQPFSPGTNNHTTLDVNLADQLKVITEKIAALETSFNKQAQTSKNENDPTLARGRWIADRNDGRRSSSNHRNNRSNSNNSRRSQTPSRRGRTRSRTPSRSGSNYRGYRSSNRSHSPHQRPPQFWHESRRGRGNNRGRGNRGTRR